MRPGINIKARSEEEKQLVKKFKLFVKLANSRGDIEFYTLNSRRRIAARVNRWYWLFFDPFIPSVVFENGREGASGIRNMARLLDRIMVRDQRKIKGPSFKRPPPFIAKTLPKPPKVKIEESKQMTERKMISDLNDLASVRDYMKRIGAESRSLKTAVVKESRGKYWTDTTVIRFGEDGVVKCDIPEMEPTDLEAAAIAREWNLYAWPELKPIHNIMNAPRMITEAPASDVFEFRNAAGMIVFVQVRIAIERDGNADKKYVPWTYWSDDKWRCAEPEGPLPIYNAHRINESPTVFIHEGAKAARHVQWMVDGETPEAREALANHPWGRELSGAVHIGWIGGALSPYRTDWTAIRKSGITRAYIVSDNDDPGREAVPAISQQLRVPTFQIQFTEEFPASFDLADPFPKSMFGKLEGVTFYVGRGFRDYLHPATWATDLIPNPSGKGRPSTRLRDCFRGMWAYIEEADMFVCTEMPDIMRSESILNKMLAPFSHSPETSKLILKAYQGRSTRVCYRPDHPGLLVTFRGSSAINLHVPTTIRAEDGDVRPFLDFIDYMFPRRDEKEEVLKWCATLIAKPTIRMGYGLLLISEKQGIGKTTLGSLILAPLVGDGNVAHPSENDILSPFNDWVANKRLAIIGEIYSGASWKAYHSLKATITDKDVTVNQKYMRPYVTENWCHIIACSNSMRALKMENDDRRWFYPEITETPWPRAKFTAFRAWLESGGLSIVKRWAENYGVYVAPSDRAPMTGRKVEMIEGSRSEAQKEAVAIAEAAVAIDTPITILIKDVVEWCRQSSQGKVFDTDYEIRKAMVDIGMRVYEKRIKVGGRLQYAIMNPAMYQAVERDAEPARLLRENVKRCSEIMDADM